MGPAPRRIHHGRHPAGLAVPDACSRRPFSWRCLPPCRSSYIQAWAFVAPGLYKREKKVALPLVLSSIFLFYAGAAFAYFVVFPLMFSFFAAATPRRRGHE